MRLPARLRARLQVGFRWYLPLQLRVQLSEQLHHTRVLFHHTSRVVSRVETNRGVWGVNTGTHFVNDLVVCIHGQNQIYLQMRTLQESTA